MAAKYIFAILAVVFVLAAASSRTPGGHAARFRTWLTIGTIFALVALFLFAQSWLDRV